MKRAVVVVCAVLALVVASSGCTLREVQLWFQIKKHTSISTDQAKSIGDLVNSKRLPGCDTRYEAGTSYATQCVPNNETSVHCAGTSGDGPAVFGPLVVTGWDSFGLDPDGDKLACVDPVGSVDVLGQVLDGIEVAGWEVDPNGRSSGPVDIYDGSVGQRIATFDTVRFDLAGLLDPYGTNHGFDETLTPVIGSVNPICVYAINVGPGSNQLMKCKTITVHDVGEYTDSTHDVVGLIEGADTVPGGIHLRGFVFDDMTPDNSALPEVDLVPSGKSNGAVVNPELTVARPDVHDAFDEPGTAAYGFDFTVPTSAATPFAGATTVCLNVQPTSGPTVQLMCRDLDT